VACILSSSCVYSEASRTSQTGAASLRKDGHGAAAFDDAQPVFQRRPPGPEPGRRDPAARYARAVAAARDGQRERALELLQGLAPRLPELGREIAALEAECQLEVGPFGVAAAYYASQPSSRSWLLAARAWGRAGNSSRALRELERVLVSPKASRRLMVQARSLRAETAERAGLLTLARRDYRWLAVEAASPGADQRYERLATLEQAESSLRGREPL
jgi:tetratricopeptide (TPR) repeat protein